MVFFLLGGMAHFHIPLALGSTFPFNITVGMPVYLELIMRTP
ncbi:MAG: sodium-dependent bicarbonate transport family permease [Flavobacteriales bacterium]|nr:sodium-dependent bicarbonate transport family permease [Flavobacteriales bacterium]